MVANAIAIQGGKPPDVYAFLFIHPADQAQRLGLERPKFATSAPNEQSPLMRRYGNTKQLKLEALESTTNP